MFHRLNDADDLANKLVELAEDSDLREFYGYKGRELVEQNYTLEQVAKRYAQLYTELV
jgi:glycosyltransferase involved in cell wall biosynthesis